MVPVFNIRLAKMGDGPTLHKLAQLSGKWEVAGIDWDFDPYPYWLLAEADNVPVGCVQICAGVPFAFCEFLCIDPALTHKQKAVVARDLCLKARAICRAAGAQFVAANIQPGLESFACVLEKHGPAIKWFDGGTTVIMRA